MSETYCGKLCENCPQRAQLNCPGCRMGPGKAYGGECSISKCCITRGHQDCEFCTTASTCFNLKSSLNAAEKRLKKRETDAAERQRRLGKSKLLGTMLMILFWLVIVSNIVNFVLGLMENQPGMALLGQIVSAVFSIMSALILVKLSSASASFRIAGICGIITAVLNFVGAVLGDEGLGTLFVLGALIPAYISMYQEYIGYAEVTEEMDAEMNQKWVRLWYWALAGLLVMATGLILSLFGSLLGALAVLASSVMTIVVAVIKIVYLYKTAKLFREYAEENQYFF